MPAAAVIPAPIAYIKVVAVKKLVVGFLAVPRMSAFQKGCVFTFWAGQNFWKSVMLFTELSREVQIIYFEKIRVFKAGILP